MSSLKDQLLETLAKTLVPLIVQHGEDALPLHLKRFLFVQVAALGTEGQAWLKKTATEIDDAVWKKLERDCQEEFESAGLPAVPSQLNEFAAFPVS